MVSRIYPPSHYGCCMRHFGKNIRNNFHNSKVVSHFYKALKAYDICEFNDHFNQIRYLVPKAAEALERIEFHTRSRAFFPENRYTTPIEFFFTLCVLFDFYVLLCRYNIMTSNIAESVHNDVER